MWNNMMRSLFGPGARFSARRKTTSSARGIHAGSAGGLWRIRPAGGVLEDRLAPAVDYVNAAWIGTPMGADPDGPSGPATSYGTDAFAVIQSGVDAAGPGGTVNLYAGTYAENVNLNAAGQTVQAVGGPVTINPPSGKALNITASGVSVLSNVSNPITIRGGTGAGQIGVDISGTNTLIQGVTITGLTGAGSSGARVTAAGSARFLTDSVTGNFVGIRVSGGTALLQDNNLSNNNIGNTSLNAGLFVSGDALVDAGQTGPGATDITGLGVSAGNNTFLGYSPGGAQAISNRNDFTGTPTGAGAVAAPNILAQNDVFGGAAAATTYGGVEAVVFHNVDDPQDAFVDYRNVQGFSAANAPAVVPNSYRFLALAAGDNLADRQASIIRGIQFQIDSPVTLDAGAVVLTRNSGNSGYTWYPNGLLPPDGTVVPAAVTTSVSGTSGLTTVTLTFTGPNNTAPSTLEPNSQATVTVASQVGPVGVQSSSLIDGRYSNAINGANVSLLFGGSGLTGASSSRDFVRLYGSLVGNLNPTQVGTISTSSILSYAAISSRFYVDLDNNGLLDASETSGFVARLIAGGFLP